MDDLLAVSKIHLVYDIAVREFHNWTFAFTLVLARCNLLYLCSAVFPCKYLVNILYVRCYQLSSNLVFFSMRLLLDTFIMLAVSLLPTESFLFFSLLTDYVETVNDSCVQNA